MTVYVDDMRAPLGRMVMCHMVADSPAELLAMADRIGVARRWLQDAGTCREHFDVCAAKRAAAVAAGAVEISQRELGAMLIARRAPFAAVEDFKRLPATSAERPSRGGV